MTATRPTDRGKRMRLVAAIADLASEAGAQILRLNAQNLPPRIKPDQSPVTAGDEAAEEIITEGLGRILPGVPVIAEEAFSRAKLPRPPGDYFLVDPIDGTRELIAGRGEYTVNIAFVESRKPVLGVVFAPQLGTLFAGAAGTALRATIRAGDKFSVDTATPIRARARPEKLTALVSRTHPDQRSDEFLATLPLAEKIPVGSSLKFARLAEGAADVYARLAPINEWDIGAGYALLTAAGGEVTAPDGAPISFGMRDDGFRVEGFIAWGAPSVFAKS
jgi:3'(2'), 5'-bisphosphate nucleotidase